MADDEVSYETLQDLLRTEKRSNRLSTVPEGFWRQLRDFLQEIEAEFLREQGKDPFSRKASMLRDRVVHAQHAAESVWTLRERKVSMLALANVKGSEPKPKGLTSKESALYDGVIEVLRASRKGVFAGTAAESLYDGPLPARKTPAPTPPDEPEPKERPEPVLSEPEPSEEAPEEEAAEPPAKPAQVPPDIPADGQVLIEALGSIPPFVGPDMQTYILEEGDTATVPQNIADLLVKRGKAKIVEVA